MDKIEVKVGQVWQNWDSRERDTHPRRLKVLEIVGDKAIVQHPSGIGGKRKILLRRFVPNSTGYKLVSE